MLVLVAGTLAALPGGRAADAKPAVLQVGMMRSFFPKDMPNATIEIMLRPFKALLEGEVGLKGELLPVAKADDLGRQIVEGKLQVGVFHGVEFGWARHKHAQLKALVTAINPQPLRAYLIVRQDSTAAAFADLKGKSLALSRLTLPYCTMYHE